MKRIAQLIVTIVTFLASAFILNLIAGVMIGNNAAGLAFLGNFPGQAQATYLGRYFGFLAQDTLGWFTFLTLSSTQNLQILAGGVMVLNSVLTYVPPLSAIPPYIGPIGLIPVMMEYGAHSPPLLTILVPALAWLLLLVGPFVITGIVAGAAAKTKKEAMGNMFLSILVIAIAGIILNFIHVSMNFTLSVDWKFTATIIQNPIYGYLLALYGTANSNEIVYAIGVSIVALVFAILNGLIFSIESAIIARKK
ncbi:MAG TPA: hypothetical protein VKM55_07745 [Candidatus Lokiarchaeia archaeon]|nr:hypothetical protein [Candidatus Lokiarchaeia archaeon]